MRRSIRWFRPISRIRFSTAPASCGRRRRPEAEKAADLTGEFHQLTERSPEYRIVAHDHVAAHDRRHRPAGDLHAGERRPAAGRDDPRLLDTALFLHVNDREIAVVTSGEPSF